MRAFGVSYGHISGRVSYGSGMVGACRRYSRLLDGLCLGIAVASSAGRGVCGPSIGRTKGRQSSYLVVLEAAVRPIGNQQQVHSWVPVDAMGAANIRYRGAS